LTLNSSLTYIGIAAFKSSKLTCLAKLSFSDNILVAAGITNAAELSYCGAQAAAAAATAKAAADAQAAASAKAQQDHDNALALGIIALGIGAVEQGLSTLTLTATKKTATSKSAIKNTKPVKKVVKKK